MRLVIGARWANGLFLRSMRGGSRMGFSASRCGAAAAALALAALMTIGDRALAAPPASNEIRIGVTTPATGPASAYGVIAKVMVAYMDKINAEGGINGRRVNMITYDDAYEPTKAMEA